MFTAEVLKLRRQRPLMGFVAFLSIGTVVIFMGYLQLRHASNPTQYSPAGCVDGFNHLIRALGVFFGALTAILIGAEAGTIDQSSGVFRDLVATGRNRLALFFVRLPAAIGVTLAFSAVGFAVGLLATFLFAGGGPTPSLGLVLQGAGWIALANVVLVAVAVSVGTFTSSRAITLTALIGLMTIVTQLVVNVSSLGSVRDILISPSLSHLVPSGTGGIGADLAMSTGVAVAVLAGWALIPTAFAAWRTNTREA
jgi:hypothetical protein